MVFKIYRIIRSRHAIRQDKKKQELLKRLFPTSHVSSSALFDNNTVLEGENVINGYVNIHSSFIGRCTVIGGHTNLSNCKVGRFCSIARNIHIQPYTHPTSFVSTYPGFFNTLNDYPFGKGTKEFNEVLTCDDGHYAIIGNDVWVGENVTIKGGVKIGDGAVIGMNALVTKDVPPYAIVGGNPTKIIRYRFDEQTIEKLIEIKWWDWPLEIIKERREDFCDLTTFVDKYIK